VQSSELITYKGPALPEAALVQMQYEALRLLNRECITAPEHSLKPLLAFGHPETPPVLQTALLSSHRATAALAMQLLWLACGAVRQDLDWRVLFLNLIGEAGLQVLDTMGSVSAGPDSWDVQDADLDPAAWPDLLPGQRIRRMAAMVRLSYDMWKAELARLMPAASYEGVPAAALAPPDAQ
jgi:hypothetical protein